jgi:peptidyl-prolyl cis-trans isomerase B (cyclophilin B)
MMFKKILKLSTFVVCMMLGVTACGNSGQPASNPKVKVEMDDGSYFVMELYPEFAPKTVENFVCLVNKGFYNGLTFHRIVPGFVIQGGCPEGTGMGGSDKNVKGEFASNGFEGNTLSHKKGVVSMARAMDKNSASSQFFVCLDDVTYLDGDYAAFGEVIEGMDTVERIAAEKTDMSDKPMTPVVMKNVTVVE